MQQIGQLIPSVLRRFQTPLFLNRSRLLEEWTAVTGPKIAAHTKPTLSETGEMCVWVDQAALAFELNQKYRQAFLKRIQAALGEKTVKKLFFRVGQLR